MDGLSNIPNDANGFSQWECDIPRFEIEACTNPARLLNKRHGSGTSDRTARNRASALLAPELSRQQRCRGVLEGGNEKRDSFRNAALRREHF